MDTILNCRVSIDMTIHGFEYHLAYYADQCKTIPKGERIP